MEDKKLLIGVLMIFRSLFLLLVFTIMITSCTAQEKKDDSKFVVATKKKDSLAAYTTKYSLSIEKLREFNPKIENDIVRKGDTIFLIGVRELPKAVKNEFTEQLVGKNGIFREIHFKGKRYFVCEVNPRLYKIEAFNQLENGKGVYDFYTLAKVKKKELIFAMNGGMFEPDLTPVGLFASSGKIYKEVNLKKEGKGNFYELQPNGIFLLDSAGTPFIITSDNYVTDKYKPKLATQSGPLLILHGTFNGNFRDGSPNLNIRNGVGVNKKGNVIFIISEDPVNFYEFSELFKDKLSCDNALYLDGVVSQFYVPELHRKPKPGPQLAILITVSKQNK